jgi:hypothetical protein
MEFDLSGAPSLRYRCGDHLAVWPINPDQEVDRLATGLGWDANMRHTVIGIQPKEPGTKVPIPTPTTPEAVLRHYLEICGPVSRDLVGLLRAFGPSESSQEALRQAYDNWSEFLSRNPFITLSRLLELADRRLHGDPFHLRSSSKPSPNSNRAIILSRRHLLLQRGVLLLLLLWSQEQRQGAVAAHSMAWQRTTSSQHTTTIVATDTVTFSLL